MSNELAVLLATQKPAYALTSASDKDHISGALGGMGAGVKRISIRGGVWRLMQGSQELGTNEERSMQVVIVDAAPKAYRTYYLGKYQEGQNDMPACWSRDGRTPAEEVPTKQGATCNDCPQNIKGSGEGDRRACRMQHRVAVALPDDPTGDLYQMIFPATSLLGEAKNGQYPLQSYAKMVAQNKVRMDSVITEMRFDTESATPKVMFKPVGFVEQDVLELLAARRAAGECEELLSMTFDLSAADTPFETTMKVPDHAKAAAPTPVAVAAKPEPTAAAPAPVAAPAPAPVVDRAPDPVVQAAPAEVPEPQPVVTAAAPAVTDRNARLQAALANFKKK